MELNQSHCAVLLSRLRALSADPKANSLPFFSPFSNRTSVDLAIFRGCKKLGFPQPHTCVALPRLWNVICRGKRMKRESKMSLEEAGANLLSSRFACVCSPLRLLG